ncbi:MAG TPA: cytochrome c-552 precursor [Rhodospirillaceae bacterium]|nr:cytochrome c-552 precursor [Rhodospirillaceae bacterium]
MRASTFAGALVAGLMLTAGPAGAVDWSAVPGRSINLFYPGQASWEWVLTPTDHSGAPVFKDGKNCGDCHDLAGKSEAPAMGEKIVTGKKLEPTPMPGKAGAITATVKMAHDADSFYVRIEFPNQPSVGEPMSPDDAKVTMMLSDGKVKEADRAGCWVACHDDLATMASSPDGKAVTKYLMRSRVKMTRQGGPEAKPAEELQAMRADGQTLEYWQAALNPGKPAKPFEGYVLGSREFKRSQTVTAEGQLENGNWVVVLSRKLSAGANYKDIAAGKTYMVGFAIHGGHAARRYHWVSFEKTMMLDGGTADFVVK